MNKGMMNKSVTGFSAAVFFAAVLLLFFLAPGSVSAATDAPGGQKETPLERYCTKCHGLDRIYEKKDPAAKWWLTIRRMSTFDGFDLDAAEQKEVYDYLRENLAIDGPGGRADQLEKEMKKK